MKTKHVLLFLFLILLFPLNAFDAPALTGRIVDQAGLLNSKEREVVTRVVMSFENATGGQIFIAILKPFDDVSIEEAGIQLMDKWKPGDKGKDNGAILLIVPQSREMRLEIGYGWEGVVNDAKAGDIIRIMAQYFKKERYCDGIIAAVGQLSYDITGKQMSEDLPVSRKEKVQIPDWLVIVFAIGFLLLCIRYPWLLLLFLGGRGGGGGGGGFGGGRGGGGGGGGASGRW